MNIPTELRSRSTALISIAMGLEEKSRFSPVTTVLRATAKLVDLPTLTVDDAVTHSLACKNSIGTATPSNQIVTIDTKTDKSIDYCDEDFNGDTVGFKNQTKNKMRRGIQKKLNIDYAAAALAGASAVVGTVDLSTDQLANQFLTNVAVEAEDNSFDWGISVQNGKVIHARHQGRGYVLAGTTAYANLKARVDSTYFQSTNNAVATSNNSFMSPQGVLVINAGSAFGDLKQLVYGTAGSMIHAYRTDNLQEWDKEVVSRTTAGVASGDLAATDAVLQRNYNMGAEIYNKPFIPASVTAYVKKQLMA